MQDQGQPSQVLKPNHASTPRKGNELSCRARTDLPTTVVHQCYLSKASPEPLPRQGKSGLLREKFKCHLKVFFSFHSSKLTRQSDRINA